MRFVGSSAFTIGGMVGRYARRQRQIRMAVARTLSVANEDVSSTAVRAWNEPPFRGGRLRRRLAGSPDSVGARDETGFVRCSINIPNLGDFADPRVVAQAARLAEEAGWDGLFIWDHLIGYNRDLVGEFAATNILLAAAALATNRIRLGSQVTPVPRRRPRQLAREIATLDRLSGGRMVLGVGLGDPVENEYGRFGEPTDPNVLAGLLDEGLAVMMLLWSGEPVSFHGRYLTVDDVIMRPTPVQHPRVPIWVGGHWPHKAPARRAARWDGAVLTTGGAWDQPPEPGVIAEMHAYIHAHRREAGLGDQPFELVVGGSTTMNAATAHGILGPLADAGATWWDERFPIDRLGRFDAVRTRIELGPPASS